jgi:hypothetical protein
MHRSICRSSAEAAVIHIAAILLLAASQAAPPPHVHPSSYSTGKNTGDCPGYRITLITPLEKGGSDAPLNYQWTPMQNR